MREISIEEHELLLNLFILKMRYEFYFEFIDWENSEYEELMKSADIIVLKDCFPVDEACEEIREVQSLLSCGCCYGSSYESANYIKEV